MSRTDKDVPYHHKLVRYGHLSNTEDPTRPRTFVRDVTLFVPANGLKDLEDTLNSLPAGAYNVTTEALYGYPVTEERAPYLRREREKNHSVPYMDYILNLDQQHVLPWFHHPIVDVRNNFEPGVTLSYSTIFFTDRSEYGASSKTRKEMSRPNTFYKVTYSIIDDYARNLSIQHPEYFMYEQPRDGFDGKGPWKWYKQIDKAKKRGKQVRRRTRDKNTFSLLKNTDISEINMDDFDDLEPSEGFHPTSYADYRY